MLIILGLAALNRVAWVLVGGRSSRMGVDKAKAESGGRALALLVAGKAAKVCHSVALVGDPATYADLGLPVIADRFPGCGPLAGIEAALAASQYEDNLIVACDMPAIDGKLIESLFEAIGTADCALPRHDDGRVEPLCAVYRRNCHPVILGALDAGIRKVTDALLWKAPSPPPGPLAIRYVRVPDAASFANLNTPEDWRRYHHG